MNVVVVHIFDALILLLLVRLTNTKSKRHCCFDVYLTAAYSYNDE